MKARSQDGGALLVVLVALLLSAAVVGGWMSVCTAQINYSLALEQASNRRIAFANADAVARQYMLGKVLATSSAAGADVTLDGGGRVVVAASTGMPFTSTTRATYNHFNPGNGDGYTFDVSAQIDDGSGLPATANRLYQAKSRSPVLSGDLFIGERPTLVPSANSSVSGSLNVVNGRTMLWMPNSPNSFSLTTQSYTAPAGAQVVLSNSSGTQLLMSNFPFVPVTSGQTTNGSTSYVGAIDVIHNTSGINSLRAKIEGDADTTNVEGSVATTTATTPGITCNGAGTVTIDLADAALRNVLITGNVSTLILQGQSTAEDYAFVDASAWAILVLVDQTAASTRDLTTVQMTQRSARRLVLAVKKTTDTTVNFDVPNAGTGPWHAILTLENTPVTWTLAGGATQSLVGGIQTDRAVAVPSGSLAISWETVPAYLEQLTARDGWVEGYNQ
jgi:hypothetical protein